MHFCILGWALGTRQRNGTAFGLHFKWRLYGARLGLDMDLWSRSLDPRWEREIEIRISKGIISVRV